MGTPVEAPIKSDPFLTRLLNQRPALPLERLDAETADWLKTLKQEAATWVSRLKMPGKRDEEWQFTDLSPLLDREFVAPKPVSLAPEILDRFIVPEAAKTRIVFVNGVYSDELSDVSGLPQGIYAGNLLQLPEAYCKYFRPFFAKQPGAEEVFTSLNTASIGDVAIVWSIPNAVIETPIHLLFLSVGEDTPTISHPRTWIVAEKQGSVKVIEQYVGIGEGDYCTNSVTEVWLGENSQIEHIRLQQESQTAVHIGTTAISQARDSRYTSHNISVGARLSRHNLEVFQTGEQTETNLNGLTVLKDEQVGDTHSLISLSHPHGTTDQLHKCIVDDSAHAIFNGKVFVPKAAQLTNAAQLNRNLLLSPKARVNTKPELQITADNVKCSHGATVSQLEAEEIFYLRSRGLTETDARRLLIDAFVAEILERLPIESLRHKLLSVRESGIRS